MAEDSFVRCGVGQNGSVPIIREHQIERVEQVRFRFDDGFTSGKYRWHLIKDAGESACGRRFKDRSQFRQ